MIKLLTLTFISFASLAALAQAPVKQGNIPTDTMASTYTDSITSAHSDSSQFSSEAAVSDSSMDEIKQSGRKKHYKRTTMSSSSRSTRKSNASNKKYK